MKERPILFSGPMVRAILEGRKTQTRRVIKARNVRFEDGIWQHDVGDSNYALPCPYGQPGDRLWVRETFLIETSGSCRYDAEGLSPGEYPDWLQRASQVHYAATTELNTLGKWRPSIHMPRWASRLTLEIVSVRVERLQGISRGDVAKEGMPYLCESGWNAIVDGLNVIQRHHWPEENFSRLWDHINGVGSWDANPWVWVIEFKRVDAKP